MSSEAQDKSGVSRRDFLNIAAFGAAIVSALGLLAGMFRMFKANVRYEESLKFKIGKPETFPSGTSRKIDDKNLFVLSDEGGIYAITAVCQHLGCIVFTTEWGYQCPCHGSRYDKDGNVIGGPAPRALPWYEITQGVDGNLIVDASKEVAKGTKYKFS